MCKHGSVSNDAALREVDSIFNKGLRAYLRILIEEIFSLKYLTLLKGTNCNRLYSH